MAMENDRLDRVERNLDDVSEKLRYMAARQQYHDKAFERFDVDMKKLNQAIAHNTENIGALIRIAELHDRRLNNLEGQ
ncbi:MAG: hypothetical protein ABIR70_21135 [Bryobacteraceae bacterium]